MGNLVEGLSHPLFKEIIYKQNTDDYLIPFHRVSDSCLLSEREPTRARWCVDTLTIIPVIRVYFQIVMEDLASFIQQGSS